MQFLCNSTAGARIAQCVSWTTGLPALRRTAIPSDPSALEGAREKRAIQASGQGSPGATPSSNPNRTLRTRKVNPQTM